MVGLSASAAVAVPVANNAATETVANLPNTFFIIYPNLPFT